MIDYEEAKYLVTAHTADDVRIKLTDYLKAQEALRARLEALVVELDQPHKNGELVVMTADKVERHLIAQRIRAILRGEEK